MVNEKETIRPLCLSFWSPPVVRPQAILIGKMIPEWIAQGIRPVVVTFKSSVVWDIDAPVYGISPFKMNKFFNKFPPLRAFFRSRYQKEIAKYIVQIMKKHDCNLLFSFANPQESNLIGAMVKEKTGIPFVSHFSDPWYDNPATPMSKLRAKRVLKQETRVIKNSNRIIFINDSLCDMVMKKYQKEWQNRGAVVHHSFSPKDYPLKASDILLNRKKGVFTLSYVGVFYKERNPEIIFQALKKIVEKDRNLEKKIVFELIGSDSGYSDFSQSDLRVLINKYKLENIVKLVPRVSYKESLRYMQLSDCLILVDIRFGKGYCLPSKLIDYAGSGSAIVGIANHESPVAYFLEKLGYKSFSYDEGDALANYLHSLIKGEIKAHRDTDFLNEYNVTQTTKKLVALFKETLLNK